MKYSFSMIACLSIVACNTRNFDHSSAHPSHVSNQLFPPLIANSEQKDRYYADIIQTIQDDSDWIHMISEGKKFISEDTELYQRLNDWVQKIDQALRQESDLSGVPTPKIYLVPTSEQIAFSLSAEKCFQNRIRPDIPWDEVSQEADAVLKSNSPLIASYSEMPLRLKCTQGSDADLKWLLGHLTPDPLGLCKYKVENQEIIGNAECYKSRSTQDDGSLTVEQNSLKNWKSETISWNAAANAFVLSTGFVSEFNREEPLLGVIAHELAHYYRNHNSSLMKFEPFPFNWTEQPQPKRPEPIKIETLSADIRQAFVELEESEFAAIDYENQEDLTYQLPTWRLIDRVVSMEEYGGIGPLCEKNTCPAECSKVIAYAKSPETRRFFKALAYYAFGTRSSLSSAVKKLSTMQPDLKSCFEKTSFPDWTEIINRTAEDELQAEASQSLHEELLKFRAWSASKVAKKKAAIELLKSRKIALYSDEIEADELALEILMKIAINPKAATDMAMKILSYESWAGVGSVGFQECHKLAKNQFRDSTGAWIHLTQVNLQDSHYRPCYRAYNMAREIAAHPEYAQGNYQTLNNSDWAALRLQARKLTP